MKFVRVGTISGSVGLDGGIRVKPLSANPEVFGKMEFLLLAKNSEPVKSLKVLEMREHNGSIFIKAAGVADEKSAEALKGLDVVIPEDSLPEENDGEIYWYKIDGSVVKDMEGRIVGKLDDYLETGSCDVFRIALADGGFALISNNKEHVLKIDAEKHEIIIDPIGLVSEEV